MKRTSDILLGVFLGIAIALVFVGWASVRSDVVALQSTSAEHNSRLVILEKQRAERLKHRSWRGQLWEFGLKMLSKFLWPRLLNVI